MASRQLLNICFARATIYREGYIWHIVQGGVLETLLKYLFLYDLLFLPKHEMVPNQRKLANKHKGASLAQVTDLVTMAYD